MNGQAGRRIEVARSGGEDFRRRLSGRLWVTLLLAILASDTKAPESITLPHTLTIRASTAPPRASRK